MNSVGLNKCKALVGSKGFRTGLGIFVTLAIVIWLYFAIDWKQVSTQLISLNYFALIPVTVLFVLHYLLRAWRWRYLLPETIPAEKEAKISVLFDSIAIGAFATLVLPGRPGEVIRPLVLSRRSEHSFSTGLVSVVIERFFDLSAVLLTFALVVTRVPGIPNWAHNGAYALGAMALGILLFTIVGCFASSPVLGLADFFLKFLPKRFSALIRRFLEDLLKGARVFRNPKRLLMVLALTVLVWLSCFAIFYAFLFLFDAEYTATISRPLLSTSLAVIISLAVAAPSSPGFIGIFQGACIAAFALFGLSPESAVAYSIVTQIHQYILTTSYSMYVLSRDNLKLTGLKAPAAPSLEPISLP